VGWRCDPLDQCSNIRALQPIPDRRAKSLLGPSSNLLWPKITATLAQKVFQRVIPKAKFRREIEHKFHQVDIMKRGTSFQSMRHGCPVALTKYHPANNNAHRVNGSINPSDRQEAVSRKQ
jgi:hypothetical protein